MPASRIHCSTRALAARCSGERYTRVRPSCCSEQRASALQRSRMRAAEGVGVAVMEENGPAASERADGWLAAPALTTSLQGIRPLPHPDSVPKIVAQRDRASGDVGAGYGNIP